MRRILPALLLLPAACTPNGGRSDGGTPWKPGTVYRTDGPANARGYLDRRGLVHAHSIHSHDACDGKPRDDAGVYDAVCLEDFRRGLCQSGHDFVFLTDHRGTFDETEYPDALLYSAAHGDALVQRGGAPVANRAACPDGTTALILAGCESETMPVGLEQHALDRGATYGSLTAEAIEREKAAGAVALVAHTEGYTVEQLRDLPLDGFEMFNIHANTFIHADVALQMILDLRNDEPDMPAPDLIFAPIISEDPAYLSRWGSVLSSGVHKVTTMGTDCHRNSFPQLLADGERVDSYRRMMIAFSNHLLVRPTADGGWTDAELKEALRAARLYGVFEYLGYAEGFDFHAAEAGGTVHEMGAQVALAAAPSLVVKMPRVANLDGNVTPPDLTARILRAREGGFDEVATGKGDLVYVPTTAGSYRAEIRMLPRHLHAVLGYNRDVLAETDFVWIYANAILITP